MYIYQTQSINPNVLGALMWEEREGWMKEDRRVNRSHGVLSWFQTRDPSHPKHVSRRCKPLRIGDGIAAIRPWYYVFITVVDWAILNVMHTIPVIRSGRDAFPLIQGEGVHWFQFHSLVIYTVTLVMIPDWHCWGKLDYSRWNTYKLSAGWHPIGYYR